jgi:hypothetical protein
MDNWLTSLVPLSTMTKLSLHPRADPWYYFLIVPLDSIPYEIRTIDYVIEYLSQ